MMAAVPSPGPQAVSAPLGNGPAPPAARPSVHIRNLNHYFGTGEARKQGLADVNLTLLPGEMVIMTGPSGSGKTTCLTLIGALRTVQEGSVQVMGRELHGMNAPELTRLRRDIGFIFQAHNLFDSLTALQNVRMALELKQHSARETDRLGTDILTRLGLGQRLHYKPQSLSGGQRQRVAIARALVNRPKVILADEPTAALDKASGREVVEMLKELAVNDGCTILLVTHDSRILDVATRIVNMVDGRIASQVLVEETLIIVEFLRRCKVFANESLTALTEVSQKMVREQFSAGTKIITQGAEGDKFYVVRDGSVEVLREQDGTLATLATLGPGDIFGESALLTGEPRNATVVARGDVALYSLKKGDFLAALNKSGSFKEQLLNIFAVRS
jgi:putative ABC transport system ATP-binding protein